MRIGDGDGGKGFTAPTNIHGADELEAIYRALAEGAARKNP
jgi:hypothetical protein